jgi:hypothetical protein
METSLGREFKFWANYSASVVETDSCLKLSIAEQYCDSRGKQQSLIAKATTQTKYADNWCLRFNRSLVKLLSGRRSNIPM